MNRIALLLAGRSYKDDVNPPRFYAPLPEGPYKGVRVIPAMENEQKQTFYANMGWDKQGVPTAANLQTCGYGAFESAIAPLRAKA